MKFIDNNNNVDDEKRGFSFGTTTHKQDKQIMTVFDEPTDNRPKNRVIQFIYQEQNRHS